MIIHVQTNIGKVSLELSPANNVMDSVVNLQEDETPKWIYPESIDFEDLKEVTGVLDSVPVPKKRLKVDLKLNGPVQLKLTTTVNGPAQVIHVQRSNWMEKVETELENFRNGEKILVDLSFSFHEFPILIKFPNGQRHSFILPIFDRSVGTLMQKIQDKTGLLVMHQMLKFGSVRLNKNESLRKYEKTWLTAQSVIDLIPITQLKPVVLKIQLWRGAPVSCSTMNVNLTDMVGELKRKIELVEEIYNVSLQFKEKKLEDLDKTLGAYGIGDGALIEVRYNTFYDLMSVGQL